MLNNGILVNEMEYVEISERNTELGESVETYRISEAKEADIGLSKTNPLI